jgi:hypothetical protein
MLLLAIPSAWGVGSFAAMNEHMPIMVAALAGCAFEAGYIGAIALADQQSATDWETTALWWTVNLFAVVASVLSNLLFFSGGTYAAISPEIATHAIPLPILGFFYGLLLHRTTVATATAAAAHDKAMADQVECPTCHETFVNKQGLYGHYSKNPTHKPTY